MRLGRVERPSTEALGVQNLTSLQQALDDLTPHGALVEVAVLAGSLAIAYGLVWLLHRGAQRAPAAASGSARGSMTACSSRWRRCWPAWSRAGA